MALWYAGDHQVRSGVRGTSEVTRRHAKGNGQQCKAECDMKRVRVFKTSVLPKLQCKPRLQKRYVIAIGVVLLLCLAAGIVHVCLSLQQDVAAPGSVGPPDPEVPQPPSPSILRVFPSGAVCSDAVLCSAVGRDILLRNGSSMDAALATMFCNGVVNCQSMGLGGGFLMTYYSHVERKAYTLNAREAAPLAATPDMFKDNPKLATTGGLAIGVPGELKGYWEAHKRFGSLPWSEVVGPAVRVCEDGYNMTQHQADALRLVNMPNSIRNDSLLMSVFTDPATGQFWKAGKLIRQTVLCNTLRLIAERGGDDMYTGGLAKTLVQDIQEVGGIITEKDLYSYRAKWSEALNVSLHNGQVLYTVPPPGSGAILAFILNILGGYNLTADSVATVDDTVVTYHRIVEAFKHAFAARTELGDQDFVDMTKVLGKLLSRDHADSVRLRIPDNTTSEDVKTYGAVYYNQEDHGTAHISVIAPNGDAVAITSTVNFYFGSGLTSRQTGIILNSVMDDFSSQYFPSAFGLPGSPANSLEPGKRPLSSMCPSIIVGEDGGVRMVVGASGGPKISTAVAYVIIRHLWFGESIKEAVDASRLHHQLFPMSLSYEYGTLNQVLRGLEKLGHKLTRQRDRGSIICAVAKIANKIFANADYRKGGDVAGL